MRITLNVVQNLKLGAVAKKVNEAGEKGLKNVIVAIANDAKKLAKKVTGNNARSIQFEVGPGGEVAKGKNEGAIYSTSGYGGYQETGLRSRKYTFKPYLKPALDMHIKELPGEIKANLR